MPGTIWRTPTAHDSSTHSIHIYQSSGMKINNGSLLAETNAEHLFVDVIV